MSLRQAKFDDHWRHVFTRQYPTRVVRAATGGLRNLADTVIDFSAGVSAIVGSNGAGKSTLAAAIAELLAKDPELRSPMEEGYRIRLRGSRNQGTVFENKTELRLSVGDDGNGKRVALGDHFEADTRWLDPSALASKCLQQIHTDQNFSDLLEPVTPLQLEQASREIASYLVGKEYSDIKIFEISDYAGFERFPYIRVTSNGAEYGSEGMGRGELSLLLTYWTLMDMDKNSILILEEPETHVSPKSQESLMNVVAKFSDELGIWVIVTTHSPTIINRIPREHVKLLVRSQGAKPLVESASKLDIALLLGGGVAHSGVLLVEDECAKEFLLAACEKLAPELLRQFEVLSATSESNITAVLKNMPRTQRWLTLVGIYDGDLRTQRFDGEFHWQRQFLPGDLSPDHTLKDLPTTKENFQELVATELRTTVERVGVALTHAEGIDHHDYLGEFAAAINLDLSFVRRAFVRVWLSDTANHEAVKKLLDDIRTAAGVQ